MQLLSGENKTEVISALCAAWIYVSFNELKSNTEINPELFPQENISPLGLQEIAVITCECFTGTDFCSSLYKFDIYRLFESPPAKIYLESRENFISLICFKGKLNT